MTLSFQLNTKRQLSKKGNLYWFDVGIDEYSIVTGLNEAELINLGLVGSDGIERVGPGRPAAPPNIVLSSLTTVKLCILT